MDASFGSGHWYEGGGLFRKTFLIHTPSSLRFNMDGINALTDASHIVLNGISKIVPAAEILADVTFDKASVRYTLIDSSTNQIVQTQTSASAAGHTPDTVVIVSGPVLSVSNAKVWSIQNPALYILTSELLDDEGDTVDVMNTTIGLRVIDWYPQSSGGFALNEHILDLRGFSHHTDFGGVGATTPDRLNLFRANALRAMGANTWRMSHNPYRPQLYDILDQLGLLCWDEVSIHSIHISLSVSLSLSLSNSLFQSFKRV